MIDFILQGYKRSFKRLTWQELQLKIALIR